MSQHLGQSHFETTSHNLIILVKKCNWVTLTFAVSNSEMSPKEDDVETASDDKYVEGGKT